MNIEMNDRKAGYWLIEQAVIVGPEIEIVDCNRQTFDTGGSRSKVTIKVTEDDIEWVPLALSTLSQFCLLLMLDQEVLYA